MGFFGRIAHVRFVIALSIVVMALMVFAPAAFAGRVTRIMYAQKNFDTYLYKPSTVSNLFISIGWGSGAPVYPVEVVNAMLQTSDGAGNPYEDQDDTGLYDVYTNPTQNVKSFVTVANQEYWIGVEPFVGDTTYSLRVWLTKRGVVNPAGTWYGKDGLGTPEATIDKTVTGNAYASDGEFYKDGAPGQLHAVGQYWAGTMAHPITNWSIYISERDDHISGAWPAYEYPWSWESNTARLFTGGGSTGSSSPAESNLNDSDPGDYGNELNTWFCVDPQTWGCATNAGDPWTGRGVPAPSADFTYYPKPMSMSWQTLPPLWMTYSWSDGMYGDANRPGYFWPHTGTDLAGKRSFSSFASPRATITWKYQGPQFSWTFSKGPRGGIARVKVDGVDVTPIGYLDPDIDLCDAAVTYGASVSFDVGGAADAWHTVEVSGTGRTSSTTMPRGYFIYHDKFVDPDEWTPASENNYDGMTAYSWEPVTGLAGPSAGAIVATKDPSSATAFTFETTNATQANRRITWFYSRGPRAGIQNVYIDGQFVGTVDQFATTVTHGQSKTWVDGGTYAGKVLSMPQGLWHTIFITGSASSNSTTAPKGYFIYSDCFSVEGGAPVEAE